MKKQEKQEANLYYIPPNIFDGYSFLGIKARNWAEAAIFAVIPGWAFWNFIPITDLGAKVVAVIVAVLPAAAAALIGYNGECLSQFAKTFILFRKNRRVLNFCMLDDDDMVEADPFIELEKELGELRGQWKETRDRQKKRKLMKKIKALQKELNMVKAERRKEDIKADKEIRKEKAAKRAQQENEAKAAAESEIARLKGEGEKVDKKTIYARYRKIHVTELPPAPKSGSVKRSTQSTQDYMPVDRIEDGIIYTKSGRMIRVLCVVPLNYPMLSAENRDLLIDNFALLLKGGPVSCHIKTMSKSADVENFIEKLQKRKDTEPYEKCRDMIDDNINKLRENASNNAVTRLFFYIFEFNEENALKGITEKEKKQALQQTYQKVRQYFQRCKNFVYEFSCEDDEVDFLYRTFYDLLDRFNAYYMSYSDKVEYVYQQAAAMNNYIVSASDFIAPLSIDFSHRKYVVIDGMFYGYMIIPSKGFREVVSGSWLFSVINAGGGVDVDIHIERGAKDKVRNAARRQINLNFAQMKDAHTNSDSYDNLENKAHGAKYIKDGLASNEDFFYATTIITVIATNEKALYQRMNSVTAILDDIDVNVVCCDFHQEDAFLSTLPLCKCAKSIFELGRRNMLTSGAASMYPYASYEMIDENGTMMGYNISNGSLVMPDIFDTNKYRSANFFICGSSGAGKTYNILTQAYAYRMADVAIYLVAPIKGHEFRRATEEIGGSFCQLGAGLNNFINICEIRKKDPEAEKISAFLDGDDQGSQLAAKLAFLDDAMRYFVPDISPEEEQLVNEHMVRVFKQFGIEFDNDSLWDIQNPGNYKTMPTLQHIRESMNSDVHLRRVYTLTNTINGIYRCFSEPTNVSVDNPFTVLDVSKINNKALPAAMYVCTEFLHGLIQEDRTKKKLIFIDELWRMVGHNASPEIAQKIVGLFKTVRGLGAGIVGCTQELEDFFSLQGGLFGKSILNQCTLKMIMKTEETSIPLLRESLNLDVREVDTIRNLERGQCLILGAGNNVVAKVVTSKKEHDLFTTDRSDLARIVKEMEVQKDGSKKPENYSAPKTPGELLSESRRKSQLIPVGRKKVKL